MDHAITIGDLLKWALICGGIVGVVGFLLYLISALGSGMSR